MYLNFLYLFSLRLCLKVSFPQFTQFYPAHSEKQFNLMEYLVNYSTEITFTQIKSCTYLHCISDHINAMFTIHWFLLMCKNLNIPQKSQNFPLGKFPQLRTTGIDKKIAL